MTSPEKKPTSREIVHQAIDELSDDEVEVFYKSSVEVRAPRPETQAAAPSKSRVRQW